MISTRPPWAPGAPGVIASVLLVFRDLKNLCRESINQLFFQFHEISWRWHLHGAPWAPGVPEIIVGVLFVLSDFENPCRARMNQIFFEYYGNSRRWHLRGGPSAPGAPGVIPCVLFVFRELKNPCRGSIQQLFFEFHERWNLNFWRWNLHGATWAPGAPEVIVGVLVVLSDFENLHRARMNQIFFEYYGTPEDDIYTEHPEHQVHLLLLRVSYSCSAISKKPVKNVWINFFSNINGYFSRINLFWPISHGNNCF